MSDFAPSLEAFKKSALGATTPLETRPHPSGAKGAQISLDEVAARIRKGRLDPRVRAWAIRSVKEGGEPRTPAGQAQAILDALRKTTTYVQDPVNAEFMQAAQDTLCLDDKGFCFKGGDCDDLCIAYGSATSSIGIPTKVVGQSFASDGVPTHVIVAIQDTKTGKWYRVDPSSKYDVGSYYPATKEVWIDPMSGSVDGDAGVGGEFVGIGQVPGLGAYQYVPSVHGNDLQELTAPQLWARGFAGGPQGLGAYQYVPSVHGNDLQELIAPYFWAHGLAGGPQVIGIGQAPGGQAPLTDQDRQAIFDSTTTQLQTALFKLQQSMIDLRTSKDNANRTRTLLNPDNPYDPEPANPIIDVTGFLTGGGWTQSMSNVCDSILSTGDTLIQYAQEALNGTRRILVDDASQNAYLEASDQDPYRIHMVERTATDSLLVFLEKPDALSPALVAAATIALTPILPALAFAFATFTFLDGVTYVASHDQNQNVSVMKVVGGLSSSTGQALTPKDVQAALQTAPQGLQGRGLGMPQVVAVLLAVALIAAVVGVATYFVVSKLADIARAHADEAAMTAVMQAITSGKMTPEQGKDILNANYQGRAALAKAEGEKDSKDPFKGAMDDIGKIVTWLVIGGVVVTGIVIGAPLIKEGVNELTAWSKQRREQLKADRRSPELAPPSPVPAAAGEPDHSCFPPGLQDAYPNPRRRRRRRRHT